jgi:hypothetical protein
MNHQSALILECSDPLLQGRMAEEQLAETGSHAPADAKGGHFPGQIMRFMRPL